MDRNVRRLLNRVSLAFATIATVSLLHLYYHNSLSCAPSGGAAYGRHRQALTLTLSPFPKTSCDFAARDHITPEKRFAKLRSSRAWRRRVDAFAALFRPLGLLSNASHVLCVSAGAGHEVAALQESGVAEVTAVDLVDFPPLVSRSDPHNLPFFDSVFDLGFSAGLAGALFPTRFVTELERTVRRGGATVLAVDRCFPKEVDEIRALFRRSSLLEVRNVTFLGSEMTLIIMKNNGKPPS
ncbi:uncharacterized protein LOC103707158 isoform X2 [Phoenix dactylifera]|uniref:Uncharacterized protein LOC103707158 isoform X2 n=1 Tax=Phoenix dactylifera TaxID=42345 RepID=A0A8B7C1S2_PHODC|nr:uncharacterized protein LOC103707158 isoform X2 [Phoenix dactylifera]